MNSVQYLINNSGKKTHAVVPIELWETILDKLNNKVEPNLTDIVYDNHANIIFDSYHLFSSMLQNISVEKWQKDFNSLNSYINFFNANEIGLLYLLRNDEFKFSLNHTDIEVSIENLSVNYKIRKLDNTPLESQDINVLQTIFKNYSQEILIKEFNKLFKIGDKVNIKFRKDAEIKRLFIYDVLKIIPNYLTQLAKHFNDSEKAKNEINDLTDAEIHLAHYLYNSKNLTQVQRALKEADERINNDLWKKYIFIDH